MEITSVFILRFSCPMHSRRDAAYLKAHANAITTAFQNGKKKKKKREITKDGNEKPW